MLFHDERAYTYRSPRPGEARWVTVGSVEARLIALVWTSREDAVRLISARRARREEKKRYRELFG